MVEHSAQWSIRIKLKPITLACLLYMMEFPTFLLLSSSLRMTYISNTYLTRTMLAFWLFHDPTKVATPPSHTLSIPFAGGSLLLDLPCLDFCYHKTIYTYKHIRLPEILLIISFLAYCLLYPSLPISKVSFLEAGAFSNCSLLILYHLEQCFSSCLCNKISGTLVKSYGVFSE